MNTVIKQEISNMTIEEKILLVEDLWDTIAASKVDIPLTASQISELEQREQNYLKNPNSGKSWQSFKSEFEA